MAAGGDYLLFVKQNQPTFYEDVSLFFREPPLDCLDWRTASTTNTGHGRVANRLITVSTELNDFLARDWHAVGQVCCLRRRVQHALKCTRASRVWHHQSHTQTCRSCPPAGIDPGSTSPSKIDCDFWRDVTLAEDARSASAKARLLMLLPFSMPLCWRSSIAVGSPT